MIKKILGCSLLLWCNLIFANPNQQPLPVDRAFAVSAQLFGKDTVILEWAIAPKHYLYQQRLHLHILKPANAQIGQIIFPTGQAKHDEIFGQYQVYADQLSLPIPIMQPDPSDTLLAVTYQGCSEDGYCYPPTTRQFQINFSQGTVSNLAKSTSVALDNSQEKPFLDLLSDQHLISLLLAFLGFGILLSLTPCVWPMIPILSGIIVGHQKTVLRGKAFRLSLIYVLSMAFTYAIAGIVIGWLGGSVQAIFQQPWIIGLFSLLFGLLALAFFGLYSLKLPASWEQRITNISRHQKSGHYLGVAIMGCLATLIVSPCVTPALVGVLGYISKTGDALLGGAALFMLGLGMGSPLLLLGLAGGKFLPKAGNWMTQVEYGFGVLFLAMAIWMLERLIPASLSLMLWSSLLIITAVYLGALSPTPSSGWGKLGKGVGVLALLYGTLLAVGAAQGNSNPLQPLAFPPNPTSFIQNSDLFTPVKNLAELQTALTTARAENKPVLIDFYANWCVSCKEMENSTFKNPEVLAQLKHFIVLRVDVSANNTADKQLLNYFQVIAPPTFIFFNAQGQWAKNATRVGKMPAAEFLAHLQTVVKS